MNIVSKVTGDSLTANEFNQIPDEMENLITSGGISPSDLDLQQITKAIAQYCADGNFYVASGTPDAIILSTNGTRIPPVALTNGFKARFKAVADNTGNCTINVANLGAKSIYYNGNQLQAGEIKSGEFYEVEYNNNSDYFILQKGSIVNTKHFATKSDLVNDTTVKNGDICFTSGYYSANDGGAGVYFIREQDVSDVEDNGSIIFIQNTLVAELITNNKAVNLKQFGAKGDNSTDDTTAIQNAINYANTVYITDGTYLSGMIDIQKDVVIRGNIAGKLKAKANFLDLNSSYALLHLSTDNKLEIYNLEIDGNYDNQYPDILQYGGYALVQCVKGSLTVDSCYIHDSKGACIRTGNIWFFNSNEYAHDITITNNRIIQKLSYCGDCINIARTRGYNNIISNNYVYGGFSGIRTQLYCKNLHFENNEVASSYNDVGITVALSENLSIKNNICYGHYANGFEIDGVVNCQVIGNVAYENGAKGFVIAEFGASNYANDSRYWGSISDDYGTDYSNQTYTSPKVSCKKTIIKNNISRNNVSFDEITGCDDTNSYINNYLENNSASSPNYQLVLSGGSLQLFQTKVESNTIISNPEDRYAIAFFDINNARLVPELKNNTVINLNSSLLSNYAVEGGYNFNEDNKYLLKADDLSGTSANIVWSLEQNTTPNTVIRKVTYTSSGDEVAYIKNKFTPDTNVQYLCKLVCKGNSNYSTFLNVNAYLGSTWKETLRDHYTFNVTTDLQEIYFMLLKPTLHDIDNIKFEITIAENTSLYIRELSIFSNLLK